VKSSNRIVTTKGTQKIIMTLYGEVTRERFNAEFAAAKERVEMFDGYERYLKNRSEAIATQEAREAAMNMQMITRGIFHEVVDIFEDDDNG